jgi:hypothetical protein
MTLDLLDVVDPWVVQAPWMTPQDIVANLDAQVEAGVAQFFWSRDGQTCWFVRRCTNRVADVHLFSRSNSIVKNSREIQERVWAGTRYSRLEMRTHVRGVWALARRLGWKYEGTCKASIELEDGSVVDEHTYGILR